MILIVDDRPENILSLKSVLQLHSFEVDSAASGEEALKKTLKTEYSLIILDVQMPGMDGFEVAEYLSGNNSTKEIPIIFLSAVNTEKKFITKGYSAGAIDYITKPIDPDILLLKVKTFHKLYEQKRELNSTSQKLQAEIAFRVKAQQQLAEKAHELNSILASIPQVAFTTLPNGKIDFVNEHWYSYSTSIAELPEIHPADAKVSESWSDWMSQNKMVEQEVRIRKTGSNDFKYHLLRMVPVFENNKTIKWVGTFTDIDEQKQAIKRKDDFLGMISHELKTPLTIINGYIQLLNSVLQDETTKDYVKKTMLQVRKLDRLVGDLLDISAIENAKLNFDLQPMDFGQHADLTVEMIRMIYPATPIIYNNSIRAKINGNAFRLEQVIMNIVSNAVKYSSPGKSVEITIKLQHENKVYFGVKDEGIGMSQENIKYVFDKFYRVRESADFAQGLGIGLHICSLILEKHNAEYGIQSEEGKGSLFYFVLPLIDNKQ